MKFLTLTALILCLSALAHAETTASACPSDPEQLLSQISAATSCSNASKLAKDCAYGTSMDVQFAGTARIVCESDFKNIKKADRLTYTSLLKRCATKFATKYDTLIMSMGSFCKLKVAELFSDLYSPIEN